MKHQTQRLKLKGNSNVQIPTLRRGHSWLALGFWLLGFPLNFELCPLTYAAAAPLPIETTLVDGDAIHSATFQSNNQKVVRNRRGIFLTPVRTRNEKMTAQQWRLSWSKDGGKTFATLFEATDATNPPVLETDSQDNLYLGRPDFVNLDVLLYRFLAAEDYRTPHLTRVPKTAAGKYSMALDEPRGQVCYFSHSGWFIRFGLDGAVKSSTLLLKKGGTAVQEYTHLNLTPDGTLHAAWTSLFVPPQGHWTYWGIHHLQSPDGGVSWQTFAGRKLTPPIAADETGPSDRITLDDEFTPSTWLANALTKDGKAHFIYAARTEPVRQHHVRFDVATGKRELDHAPELRGETISLNVGDGFPASSTRTNGDPLFVIGHTAKAPLRLGCLRSDDNGATWRDHAVSETFLQPYAVGGCREITPDGFIIGSFTEVVNAARGAESKGRVHFFRIASQPAASKALKP